MARPKMIDEGIGSSNTGKYDFLGAAADPTDEALLAKLAEKAKRSGTGEASALRNLAGMLVFQFQESDRNELIFNAMPSFLDGMTVERGKAKGQPVTLKSLYSAVRGVVADGGDNMATIRVVWIATADDPKENPGEGILSIQRNDRDFEPTVKGRARKAKDETPAEDGGEAVTEDATDSEAVAS